MIAANRLAALIAHEIRLQWRYGIHGAYALVIALYAVAIAQAGRHLPPWVPGVVIFTDPAALGFFFLGALMMLEKSERTRAALAITPLTALDYLVSKASTLTALALIASTILHGFIGKEGNLPLLLLAVVLTSVQYVAIGVPIALRFETVTGYLIGSSALLAPVIAPGFLALLQPTPPWALAIPAVSQLKLILVATGGTTTDRMELAIMIGIASAAAIAASWYALHALNAEFARR